MAGEPIPAATLILVRDVDRGPPELLMVERSPALAFAPGALVFPGGRIDAGDAKLAIVLGIDDGGARIAAIRETLEECGVPAALNPLPGSERSYAMQNALLAGAKFGNLLDGLEIRHAAMMPYARWVPGPEVSRRFDTHFFIAKASDKVAPRVGSSECVAVTWISAAGALEAEGRCEAKLIYPTRKNLERLARFDSYDAMLQDALSHPVVPVTASVEMIGGEQMVTIADGLGYPVTRDRLSKVWRG